VAAAVRGKVAVIAAGERWPDGTLRPAWEDLVGAGAVIAALPGTRSPEAQLAADAFEAARLDGQLLACMSGRELDELGFRADVALAADLDASPHAPELVDDAYVSPR
jgi:2-phosphosulfolactate phosphatase